ncbi:hypothetical protein BJ684DRAFT_15121 [Piptocephalis cylindrospora]|uniref:LIM zinc-binding domain-containing protein n=1 Tax=Piptocephalis cylindrospora TaxID=1907219 RepID=A0A4V1IYH4_9FUNG|nr:hypothetical protein BJ684DRAFT_15121 [Piptocephalis cylindrospora]|eukprot:RKP14569.1 hypothetical protein BJ684DRAFT_15121 [Piptocephalis cylindrospora]
MGTEPRHPAGTPLTDPQAKTAPSSSSSSSTSNPPPLSSSASSPSIPTISQYQTPPPPPPAPALVSALSSSAPGDTSVATSPASPQAPSGEWLACAECGQVIEGRMVRALGAAYHLQCFRCAECGVAVAQRFFPIESSKGGRRYPLCETDYFRRLDLICATCNGALRSSYITALDKKYHMNHFTCSACATVFGPQDSYYEHDGHVYCHYHFSIRFAGKCIGCRYPILKQFVEINKQPGPNAPPSSSSSTSAPTNISPPSSTTTTTVTHSPLSAASMTPMGADEHWHPECYMINKFWNVRLASSARNKALDKEPQVISPQAIKRLKFEQEQMEERVYQIWTVLSAFEESSAACISQMLLDVSGGAYLEGVRMSASFIQHVEVLFAAVDRLERQLGRFGDSTASRFNPIRKATSD